MVKKENMSKNDGIFDATPIDMTCDDVYKWKEEPKLSLNHPVYV